MAAIAASPRTSTAMDPPPTTTSRTVRHASPAAMNPPSSTTTSQIKTPLSSTYPNSIHSPLRSSHKLPTTSTTEVKTPLTPPSAYLDFLRILSPNPYTPSPLSTGTSTRFSHDNSNYPSPAWPSATLRDDKSLLLRPTISSARSTDSSLSRSSFSSEASSALSAAAGAAASSIDRSSAPPVANTSRPLQRPSELAFGRSHSDPIHPTTTSNSTGNNGVATTTITQTDPTTGTRTTEITRPQTARAALQPGTPRLIIPPSPSSTIETMSPAQRSAPATTVNVPHSACPPSAISAHAQSAAGGRSANGWTPASAVGRENLWARAATNSNSAAGPHAGPTSNPSSAVGSGGRTSSSPVTIKHVVTRTVTYHRRPGVPAVQGPARPGVGAAAVRAAGQAQSPLSAMAIQEQEEEDEDRDRRRPLVGEVPRGKRRRVE